MALQPCSCISDIDAKLEEHRLDTAICFGHGALVSRTYSGLIRKDTGNPERRSSKPRLFAHFFCPFCGTRYDPEPAAPAAGAEGGAA